MPHFVQNNIPAVTGAVRSGADSFVAITGNGAMATTQVIQGDQVTNWNTLAASISNLTELWLVVGVPTALAPAAVNAHKGGRSVGSVYHLAREVVRLK